MSVKTHEIVVKVEMPHGEPVRTFKVRVTQEAYSHVSFPFEMMGEVVKEALEESFYEVEEA